ncbi:MAG: hypothetical protein L6R30_26480 [Thermoanaerobaculia bacterium]|nr:hypothetical protein [Thermoanaerobaculia bacterium]
MTDQSLESKVLQEDLLSTLLDLEAAHLRSQALTTLDLAVPAATLPYNSARVLSYAQTYCRTGNDCPDNMFALDCTHFLCHSLAATGVLVTNPSAMCQRKLCIRVNDLAAAFNNSVGRFSNVLRISTHAQTRRGDYCFIPSWFGLSKEHGMLLASVVSDK